MPLARYEKTCAGRALNFSAAAAAEAASASLTSPLSLSIETPRLSSSARSLTPRSSTANFSRKVRCSAAVLDGASPAPSRAETRSVLTLPSCPRLFCNSPSGTKTARTAVCCGRTENSPSDSGASDSRTFKRSVRPTSSFRPCNDSTGMAEGFSTLSNRTSPAPALNSSASAALSKASSPRGVRASASPRPWNFQKRSSTP
jgi:hypothetical protein